MLDGNMLSLLHVVVALRAAGGCVFIVILSRRSRRCRCTAVCINSSLRATGRVI